MKRIKVDGVIHSFPDDVTDEEINEIFSSQKSQEPSWGYIKQQHPYLSKAAEYLHGTPGLEAAGNIAEQFNRGVQGTGLPNVAKGFFESNADLIRGAGNLIPGVNIPKMRGTAVPEVNPLIQQIGESIGSLGSAIPAYKGYKSLEEGAKIAPIIGKMPQYLQKILSGASAGAAFSPDNRLEGGLLGGSLSAGGEAVEKVPSEIKKLFPENPYKVIQKGYDKKKEVASRLFDEAGKAVEKSGTKINLPSNLISEIIEIGPKTQKFKKFVDKAKDGDFKSLRKLQTELFHRGERYKSSILGSDQDLGDLIFEKRAEINDAITRELNNKGLPDAAKNINKARSQWKSLEDTYHSNNMISKLVGPNREVPSSMSPLKKDATDINRLKQMHPEIEKYLKLHKRSKQTAGALGALGLGGGLKTAYNELSK